MKRSLVCLAMWLWSAWAVAAVNTPEPQPQLDTHFAVGGVYTTPAGPEHAPLALAVQDREHVLLLASERSGDTGRLVVQRLRPDGTLDETFGVGGVWRPDQSSSYYAVEGTLTVMPDQRLLVGERRDTGTALYRLSPDGQPDASFGTAGQVHLGFDVQTVLVDTGGGLVLAGQQPNLANDARPVWALARLRADGSKDPSFQGGFIRPFGLTEGAALSAQWAGSGTFLVAGYQSDAVQHQTQPLLIKFRADGRLDPGFGTGGVVRPLTEPSCSFAVLTLDQRGRPLAAGPCGPHESQELYQQFSARYLPDGTPDLTFSQRGHRLADDTVRAIALQPDGSLVLGGAVLGHEGVAGAFVEQLSPDGQPFAGQSKDSRLDLTLFDWPGKTQHNIAVTKVMGLLFDAQQRLLVLLLASWWDDQGNQMTEEVLLRFAAPFSLR